MAAQAIQSQEVSVFRFADVLGPGFQERKIAGYCRLF